MGIRNWFKRQNKVDPPGGKKSRAYQAIVLIDDSGFIPAAQFESSESLENLLEASTWSYSCITMNAEALASLPGIVQVAGKKEGEGRWIDALPDSSAAAKDLHQLLQAPFGTGPMVPRWNWQQLIEVIAQQVYLAGNAFLKPEKNQNLSRLLALFLLREPGKVKAVENQAGVPTLFKYGTTQYLPDELVNIQNAHPTSYWKGQSPTRAALGDMQIDSVAHKRQQYNITNRISANVVFRVSGYFGATPEQKKEIERDISENYSGASKQGVPMIVGEDIVIEKLPDTGIGTEIFETRNFAKRGMLAVFHTPPPLIGEYDQATLSNFSQAVKIWWQSGLFPMLGTIYNALNAQVIHPVYGPDIRLWYDLTGSDIGLLVVKDRIDVARGLVDLGYPANEASAKAGLSMRKHPELDIPNAPMVTAGRTEPPTPATGSAQP